MVDKIKIGNSEYNKKDYVEYKKKLKSCEKKVRSQDGNYNEYAVCNASVKKPKYSDLSEKETRLVQRTEKNLGRKTHAIKKRNGNYDVYNVE
jgi:hypothetical protein